jgi:hypothetical protein
LFEIVAGGGTESPADLTRLAPFSLPEWLGRRAPSFTDHKVINMQSFHAGLVQALKDAREQGQTDRSGGVLSLT